MPTYTYRCQPCQDFDVITAMSRRTDHWECPRCGQPARRIITAPRLQTTPTTARRIADAAAASAEAPRVMRRDGERHAPPLRDPRHAALPRW
ncbi:zinc ribbon domain-containing protein [Phytoactinopolyspora alkaliphila]|uniref:Zinc ribbon domain-containing protein n=1 Tax=Phytoactinopolyspora alkaliphila TaxID=1783498 RepID=A0A6N9YP65_9ACTN|nr:zinc ribbon domain-containing protein [Phytoactinopolyspora alkaliphila]NED96720.1 zinc ribbon domain-containing protein [Phytoactinopolyspora alkaliphila]